MTKNFTIFIDNEPYEAPGKSMTANEILALGEILVTEHYLIEIRGQQQVSFQGKGEEEIHLHEKSKFISVFTGATTVSDCSMTGAALFAAQLRSAGHEVEELADHHLKIRYTVDVGKFSGTELMIGIVVPEDFPLTPPTGPHVGKRLHKDQGGGTHPDGGIHPSSKHSKHFGNDWQYWSRPCHGWADGKRDASSYMSFIRGLWASQ